MIKAVIFDWGGVIAPNLNGGWMNILMDMLGISFEELLPHWYAAGYEEFSKGHIDEKTFWIQFEKSFGRPLHIDTSKIWIEGGALLPFPGLMEFIKQLKAGGILIAVLSNTVRPLSEKLRDAGLYDDFDAVVLSDEVGIVKPSPAIYEEVINRLGVLPTECMYVDDMEKNLLPARGMGMTTVLANNSPVDTMSKIRSLLSF